MEIMMVYLVKNNGVTKIKRFIMKNVKFKVLFITGLLMVSTSYLAVYAAEDKGDKSKKEKGNKVKTRKS